MIEYMHIYLVTILLFHRINCIDCFATLQQEIGPAHHASKQTKNTKNKPSSLFVSFATCTHIRAHTHTRNVNASENPCEKFRANRMKCSAKHWMRWTVKNLVISRLFTSPEKNKNKAHKRAKINIPKKKHDGKKYDATKQNSCPKRKSRLFFIMILRFGCVVAPGQNMFNIALCVFGFPSSSSLLFFVRIRFMYYSIIMVGILCSVCGKSVSAARNVHEQ